MSPVRQVLQPQQLSIVLRTVQARKHCVISHRDLQHPIWIGSDYGSGSLIVGSPEQFLENGPPKDHGMPPPTRAVRDNDGPPRHPELVHQTAHRLDLHVRQVDRPRNEGINWMAEHSLDASPQRPYRPRLGHGVQQHGYTF